MTDLNREKNKVQTSNAPSANSRVSFSPMDWACSNFSTRTARRSTVSRI